VVYIYPPESAYFSDAIDPLSSDPNASADDILPTHA